MKTSKSPYLENNWRLADVIAAIQVMGSYPYASRVVNSWAEKLGVPLSADSWSHIFKEHPEFFRLSDDDWASLRWRHAYDKNYDAESGKELTREEKEDLPKEAQTNLSRKVLTADQVEALLNTAIELHSRAVAVQQESRWLVPIIASFIGGILGAILGAVLKGG